MINLSKKAMYSPKVWLAAIKAPQWYLAESTKDFNADRKQISYPLYKKAFNRKPYQDIGFVRIHNVGLEISEKSEFVADVLIHDSSGEIKSYWADMRAFVDARNDYLSSIEERIDGEVMSDDEPEFILDMGRSEFTRFVKLSYAAFRYDSEMLCGVPLFTPRKSLNEIVAEQGLKKSDFVHWIDFAYLIKEDAACVYDVTKSGFSRKKRIRKSGRSHVPDISDFLCPTHA